MKKILLGVVLLGLLGCKEPTQRDIPKARLSTYCIEGVAYYHLSNGLVPAFGRDSKVILCEEKTYEP